MGSFTGPLQFVIGTRLTLLPQQLPYYSPFVFQHGAGILRRA